MYTHYLTYSLIMVKIYVSFFIQIDNISILNTKLKEKTLLNFLNKMKIFDVLEKIQRNLNKKK